MGRNRLASVRRLSLMKSRLASSAAGEVKLGLIHLTWQRASRSRAAMSSHPAPHISLLHAPREASHIWLQRPGNPALLGCIHQSNVPPPAIDACDAPPLLMHQSMGISYSVHLQWQAFSLELLILRLCTPIVFLLCHLSYK